MWGRYVVGGVDFMERMGNMEYCFSYQFFGYMKRGVDKYMYMYIYIYLTK